MNLQALDLKKWESEHTQWQSQVIRLEEELERVHHTQLELDHQKQENLALKETIDRLKYEMEEMRQSTSAGPASIGSFSAKNSISRSLGAELASQMKDINWDAQDDVEEAEEVEREVLEDEDTEGEEFVQTIITRTKKASVCSLVRCASILMIYIFCRRWQVEPNALRLSLSRIRRPTPMLRSSITHLQALSLLRRSLKLAPSSRRFPFRP